MDIDYRINFSYDVMHKLFPIPVGHHISISKDVISKDEVHKHLHETHINQLNALIEELFRSKIYLKNLPVVRKPLVFSTI